MALPVYINSTFLSQFTTESVVGMIYAVAAIGTILGLASINGFLRRHGNYNLAISFILLQIIALAGLMISKSLLLAFPFFVAHLMLSSFIVFNIDIFLESHSNDAHTGGIRGLFLTTLNIAWILSPLLASSLITTDDYWKLYAAAIGLSLPLLYLIKKNFKHYKDRQYPTTSFVSTFKRVWNNERFYYIFIANIILNTFYIWMVIYTPIYLHQHIGFDWDTIGLIFTIMLLPFVIFQFKLGKLADEKYGEKEFLVIGFIIMALATASLAFINGANIWLWAALLFTTRIGASMVEIMVETYFFKQIHTRDSNILSMYRITRPTAAIVAPLFMTVCLLITDFKYTFVLLGILVLAGVYYSMKIVDTK